MLNVNSNGNRFSDCLYVPLVIIDISVVLSFLWQSFEVATSTRFHVKIFQAFSISLHPLATVSEKCTVFFSCFILILQSTHRDDHQ